jgi:hypothetical protein
MNVLLIRTNIGYKSDELNESILSITHLFGSLRTLSTALCICRGAFIAIEVAKGNAQDAEDMLWDCAKLLSGFV